MQMVEVQVQESMRVAGAASVPDRRRLLWPLETSSLHKLGQETPPYCLVLSNPSGNDQVMIAISNSS